jgi:putative pyruvate formate lyase activating enzyme
MLSLREPTNPDREFLLKDFEPAYFNAYRRGEFSQRVQDALAELADCCACPRNCHVNRLLDRARVCHTGRQAIVSSAFAHFGEEDCLRGRRGSGTIFFAMCNLRCVFCQNWDISQHKSGRECNADEIAALMLELQSQGCHNINFVTPEHVAPQIVEAIAAAVARGLHVPVVYNTSAYDALASLRLMDGLVDIYMPDFKYWTYESSRRLLKAKDYAQRAREAITEMHRQVGDLRFGPDGLARRGLLVRHLVMPGAEDETRAIFRWLAEEISPDTYINIMDQYRPLHQVTDPASRGKYSDIDRRPCRTEIRAAFDAAREVGLWRFDTHWILDRW